MPRVVFNTVPTPLLQESNSLDCGGVLYPNPPSVTIAARTDPSVPITGTANAPTPPPPLMKIFDSHALEEPSVFSF